MDTNLSVIMPLYNEEDLVWHTVETNLLHLRASEISFEMILINDGSSDSTGQVIDRLANEHHEISVFHKPENGGFGSAVCKGIAEASGSWILCLPADCPLTALSIREFINAMGKADVIVAYRPERMGYSLRMRANSRIFHWLATRLFRIRIKDFNWVHMYRKGIFTEGPVPIRSKGLFMLTEMIVRAHRQGFTFFEICVDQPQRQAGSATASKWSAALDTAWEMLAFYLSNVTRRH